MSEIGDADDADTIALAFLKKQGYSEAASADKLKSAVLLENGLWHLKYVFTKWAVEKTAEIWIDSKTGNVKGFNVVP